MDRQLGYSEDVVYMPTVFKSDSFEARSSLVGRSQRRYDAMTSLTS